MAEKDPNKLYNGIKSLQDDLESIRTLVDQITENSKTLMNDANTFGGVIAKVFKEQMAKYFIPGVQGIAEPIDNLVSGDRVPGSLKDLTIFLDSVPLAMIRQEPSVTELASPVVPKNVNLDTPAGKVESPVDEIPQNQSYQTEAAPIEESKLHEDRSWVKNGDYVKITGNPASKNEGRGLEFIDCTPDDFERHIGDIGKVVKRAGQWLIGVKFEDDPRIYYYDKEYGCYVKVKDGDAIEESKKKPSVENKKKLSESSAEEDETPGIWQVRRVSGIGSSLGEEISNIEPQVVCEFDTKEEAEERKAELEASVLPEEKELLGTSYEIHKVPLKVEE